MHRCSAAEQNHSGPFPYPRRRRENRPLCSMRKKTIRIFNLVIYKCISIIYILFYNRHDTKRVPTSTTLSDAMFRITTFFYTGGVESTVVPGALRLSSLSAVVFVSKHFSIWKKTYSSRITRAIKTMSDETRR